MKLGIFSDIHGNIEALEAIVSRLRDRGAERFICCGDIVGYGPDPKLCLDRVRDLRCTCVAGNHDYGAVGKTPLASFSPAANRAVRWTQPLLSAADRRYLQDLLLTAEYDSLLVVHSSPSAPAAWEYVLTPDEALAEMAFVTGPVCVVGHSHQPLTVEIAADGEPRLIQEDAFALKPGARYFINAGSVGQPRDGDPRASAILYDVELQQMTRIRVAYDCTAVQAKIRAAGLPEFLASRLAAGR